MFFTMMVTGEKRNSEEECMVNKATAVLLDIEGTTTSISFVKDKLFPYVREQLQTYVDSHWEDDEFKKDLQALKDQSKKDLEDKVEGLILIEDGEKEKETLVKNILWQMDLGRKTTALKQLQGHIWRKGYENGKLKGHIYDDVPSCLKEWSEDGCRLFIYSSESVEAQKLLFNNTEEGDLLNFLSGHYDIEVGPKTESSSYSSIAKSIGCDGEQILFLTDVVKEARAAKSAGFQTLIVIREGNTELTDDEKKDFVTVSSFKEIVFETSAKKKKVSHGDESVEAEKKVEKFSSLTDPAAQNVNRKLHVSCSRTTEKVSEELEDKVATISAKVNEETWQQNRDRVGRLIGKSDFRTLVEETMYADKTSFLPFFIEKLSSYTMIAVPPRFGKSSLLSMCETFFQIEVDDKGNSIDTNKSPNRKIFEEKDLLVYKNQEFFNKFFGKYPVISLTFRKVNVTSMIEFKKSLHEMVDDTLKKHQKFLRSQDNPEIQESIMSKKCDPEKRLVELSEILSHFYGNKCIVLIDEFDSVVDGLIFHKTTNDPPEPYLNRVARFMGLFLKDNENIFQCLVLVRTIMRGVLSMDANIFQYLYLMERPDLCPFFGLTEEEVEYMLMMCHLQNNSSQVRKWYKGYGSEPLPIYNTFSVLLYLKTQDFSTYWSDSAGVKNLQHLFTSPSVQNKIRNVIQEEDLTFNISYTAKITPAQVTQLRKYFCDSGSSMENDPLQDIFFQYLFYSGYFSAVRKVGEPSLTLRIPNHEIRTHFQFLLKEGLITALKKNVPRKTVHEYINSVAGLEKGSEASFNRFRESIVDLLADRCFSHEDVYNGILHTAASKLLFEHDKFEVDGFVDVDGKRPDVIYLLPNTLGIVETKRNKSAKRAFDDILDRKYYNLIKKHGKENVLLTGINITYSYEVEKHSVSLEALMLEKEVMLSFKKEDLIKYLKNQREKSAIKLD